METEQSIVGMSRHPGRTRGLFRSQGFYEVLCRAVNSSQTCFCDRNETVPEQRAADEAKGVSNILSDINTAAFP